MPHFITIKLKNGEDLVGVLESEYEKHILINNPIEIKIDPNNGFYAKSWLLFAEKNTIPIMKEDILFLDNANDKAIHYYEEFMEQITSRGRAEEIREDEEYASDLEELFTALIESRNTKLH